jgi:hypothetical protein
MANGTTPAISEPNANQPIWASDVMAATLRELGIPYVALVPGAQHNICLARAPLGWVAEAYEFPDPLDYLGKDGGGGVGSGPGNAIGAALALMDTDRIAVSVIGDGDFLQGNTAL